ncbi:hypothetical protein JB92DRAFT_3006350, partial [Gautieria morchelliformis]
CACVCVWAMLADGWMARRGGEDSKRVMQDGRAVYIQREISYIALVPLAGLIYTRHTHTHPTVPSTGRHPGNIII